MNITTLLVLITAAITYPINYKAMNNISEINSIESTISDQTNPLLAKWTGRYGGVPPFDKIKVSHFKPALEAAMKEKRQEIDQIVSNTSVPDFENTVVAFERAGESLKRVQAIYNVWSSNLSTREFQEVEREIAPKLAAFNDEIIQNVKLFERIESVYNSRTKNSLNEEQQRLVWLHYNNFVRAGAALDGDAKNKLSEMNQRLAVLYTTFSQNILADEANYYVILEHKNELAGLPQSIIEAASAEALDKNLVNKWVITNTRSSVDPFLTYSENRGLREKVWKMFVSRGDNGNDNDNNTIITQILQLRLRRAQVLGYETHAHWKLANTMAKTPEQALNLMEALWKPATERVKEEVADMQAMAQRERKNISIEPWDYRYYMEKVRKQRYDLDQDEIKNYLQLNNMREGLFFVAEELFDLSFKRVDAPVFHPDVTVYEVTDKTTGQHVGLWYFDPFSRPGKHSGAWMSDYRSQQKLKNVTPIVSNNSNFVKGKPGEPILISWDDAVTLFHEFGHALHGLLSNVTYPSLSGTEVFQDYVEFPSQLLEHWLSTPEVLQRFARYYKTNEPIPIELVKKIKNAATFNHGFTTTEYLASALIDMKLHLSTSLNIDPDKFEKETLSNIGMPRELVMRHRTPQFQHIFSSDDYAAGYYSYLWSDVLTADGYEAFLEAGGPYDKHVAQRLYRYILSKGNTADPAEAYRSFRGKDPKLDALLKKRGFITKTHDK